MNASMRSRRDSTSGEGLKSTAESYRLDARVLRRCEGAPPGATRFMREGQPVLSPARPRRDAAVAGEELALRLEEPGELDLVDVGKRPLEHAWSLSAGDLRRERQEELIGEAALAEPAVQGRASLAEN